MGKRIDMTNWEMWNHGVPDSRAIVIRANENYWKEKGLTRYHLYWDCQCLCGNLFSARGEDLRSGRVKSCGCYHRDISKTLMEQRRDNYSLVGHHFGKLLVLEDTGYRTSAGLVIWKCLCDCGNITYASTDILTKGNKKSCGCLKLGRPTKYTDDYIGKKYGILTVLEHLKIQHTELEYLCQCDCGNLHVARICDLISGRVTSCGCIKSRGEKLIATILNENNIPFIQEKTYIDCVSEKNKPLRFDFYIDNKFLLEYDGIQHFEACERGGWNTEENLVNTQNHDKIKNEYAKQHNILLKRIPYWDYNQITLENIMSDKWLINKEE